MPRLTEIDFVVRRKVLRDCWFGSGELFSVLKPIEQRDLHRYFTVTRSVGPALLDSHRRQVTLEDPSLPQRAGKAFRKLEQAIARQQERSQLRPKPTKQAGRSKHQRIVVRSVMNLEPDFKHLAKTLIDLAISIEERERDQSSDADRLAS